MTTMLSAQELARLIERVFAPAQSEKSMAILLDLPDEVVADTQGWKQRREMAADWARMLMEYKPFPMQVELIVYRNARSNNGELPCTAWRLDATQGRQALPVDTASISQQPSITFDQIFKSHPIFVAPTEFSATAPLKLAAATYRFRAATMPGFNSDMIPALRIDYDAVNRRVHQLKSLLDSATSARCRFWVDRTHSYELFLDLRYRSAHASGGVFPTAGQAGNLPSGETYIVPYEGENSAAPSRSEGLLPVQLGKDIVIYEIKHNKAINVINHDSSDTAKQQSELIRKEPAYANLAELGLGVLADFGLEPIGQVLLDEKLGLHIAFGRSDHFGGSVGPGDFSSPEAVVHIDRVYVQKLQPRICVSAVDLQMPPNRQVPLIRDGQYVVQFE